MAQVIWNGNKNRDDVWNGKQTWDIEIAEKSIPKSRL